jgi:ribonuclease BN (tRNA processing enzyme)
MEIRILGASGGCAAGCAPSSYLVEGRLVVDAGGVASALTIEEQVRVKDVVLTHSHLDHVRDLPLLLINGDRAGVALRVHALPETLDAVRRHLFNREIWFDPFSIPGPPMIEALPTPTGRTVEIGGFRVTGFPLHHTVPSAGWLLDDGRRAVYFAGDTDEDDCLTPVVKAAGSRLKAAFLEASFPDEQAEFAKKTGHLTPAGLARAARALPAGIPLFVTHGKPGFEDRIAEQVKATGNPSLRCVRSGETIEV